ncbi:MAG: tetratricopeptide (TPR) repeat protein [Bacteroidia bacterium]|jgi:tetratricopeptide (TPR) repeat protein
MASLNDQVAQLHRNAQTAMRAGDLRQTHKLCIELLKIDPRHADAWFLCGVIAAHNGLQTKAVEIINKAVALAPEKAEYHAELGKNLLANGELELALQSAETALSLEPSSVTTLNTLGALLSHCGEHDKALLSFVRAGKKITQGKAAQDSKWLADFYFNWGASSQFAGHFAQAEELLEKAIALQPDYFRAHYALSSIRQQSTQKNHINHLTTLRERVANARDQMHIGHALAKELEDLGQYEESLASLNWAKSAQREVVNYDFNSDKTLLSKTASLFNANWFDRAEEACDSEEPIFIVGMPRTGTTLVEKILASHSQVFAAGELQNFPLQVKKSLRGSSAGPLDIETMEQAAAEPIFHLGQNYLQSTRPRTGHSARFIDKLPLNFINLGLIAKALPKAKIICLRRDPMDVCLSNYRQLFAGNFPYYRYNLNLLDCGRYYIAFDKLMQHWHNRMPGMIYDIHYEALVADTDAQARSLLKFCDLTWEDQCLDFHSSGGSVATPSAVQVRQGIYSSSVDRWRRYGDAMDPLHELLTSAGFYT